MGPSGLRVISRGSELAVAQVEEALAVFGNALPAGTRFTREVLDTPGDRDLRTPLDTPDVPDDFFTRDLDLALLEDRADLSVHSAKDLPETLANGLEVAALLPTVDPRDALVLRRDLPAGATPQNVGTSSPRRMEHVQTAMPGIETRPIRGSIRERLRQLDEGAFDALIVAACALQRLGLKDRIDRFLDYDPAPNQGRLAVVTRSADRDLVRALRTFDVRRRAGLVALLGCPADAAMLPERSRRYLEAADVILHDRLVPDEVLHGYGDRSEAVGKAGGRPSIAQSEVHRRMLMYAEKGLLVVRLHGGDPGVFGHLAEELEFLHAWGLRVDLIPAVTAAQAAAARAQAPLTDRGRGRQVTFISGHAAKDGKEEGAPGPKDGHLAIYMGVANRTGWVARLRRSGWPDDGTVVVAERIGYRNERVRICSLADMDGLEVEGPAVMLAGPKPYGPVAPTLFLGTDPDAFLAFGPLLHWPLIELRPRALAERVAVLDRHLTGMDGILFPSRYAVRVFFEALIEVGDARKLAGLKLLAVGPATAREMRRHGLRADLAAASLGGVRDLALKLSDDLRGRYLYPCSDAAPVEDRKAVFEPHGLDMVPAVFYENLRSPRGDLPAASFNRVLFTSASTVKAYFEDYPQEKGADRTWLAVGPSTREALEALGLEVEVIQRKERKG